MNSNNYIVSFPVGWTEHDKLEEFTDHFKIWKFYEDSPYKRGDGDRQYKTTNFNYDVNGIFRTI